MEVFDAGFQDLLKLAGNRTGDDNLKQGLAGSVLSLNLVYTITVSIFTISLAVGEVSVR